MGILDILGKLPNLNPHQRQRIEDAEHLLERTTKEKEDAEAEVERLSKNNEELRRENARLQEQLRGPDRFAEEREKVLAFVAGIGRRPVPSRMGPHWDTEDIDRVFPTDVAEQLGMNLVVAQHHVDQLAERDLITPIRNYVVGTSYVVSEAGRSYLVRHGLAS